MHESCKHFLTALLEIDPGLGAVHTDSIGYWAPEEPPVITLFSDLGLAIAERFGGGRGNGRGNGRGVEATERDRLLFEHIEDGIRDGDEALSTAVATGLVEAMTVVGWRQPKLWAHIRSCMGDRSGAHADAWLAPC